ncbi:glycoside hydrolase family 10 protein [Planktothrix sp. FACHB-1365]|uniref:glycoside hydrolase family 10 protein n=1 Tax=Planktothrix sp. FACHB-1365 TaxID=2692855 RepID=UPI001683666B|nr:family 10 glycosylhydrolase [Planktothrix sp. FACHB-1365]MBD2480718.1 family 10 glycosylhydrolase [Planktothrix sp. FACHB-1365]
MKFRKKIILIIYGISSLILSLILAIALLIPPTPSQPILIIPNEIRGVWLTNVSSGVLFFPWGMNRALHQLSDLKFNTIYPVVWNRGVTFYKSAVARRVIGRSQDSLLNLTQLGGDILSKIVTEGHRNGLKVIPWFEYGFMAPKNSAIVQRHPDWIAQTRKGEKALNHFRNTEDVSYQTKIKNWIVNQILEWMTIKNVWLNPLHPEVQQFIEDLILEVVMKYNIDGIQLDDHFGLPVEFGYDEYTIQLYQQEHNNQLPPNNPYNQEWRNWRANKITELVQRIVKSVKEVKPDCMISLSPNSYEYTYEMYLQDWLTWVNQGLVDDIVLQVYRDSMVKFISELDHESVQIARRKVPVIIGLLSGTLRHPVPMEQIEKQMKVVRDRGFDGVSFFYWETLWSYFTPDSPRHRRQIFKELFGNI